MPATQAAPFHLTDGELVAVTRNGSTVIAP
jgi:hypothetical protein